MRPVFYLDGMPLRNNGTWGVWKTENYGSERIEVLRGPASVLYGMASPGGVVNIVSKLPTAEPVREIQLQYGNDARRQIAGDFSGALDAEGKVLYRITGVLRDAQLPGGSSRDDRTYIAPSITWKPSADTTFTLLGQYQKNRAGAYSRIRPMEGSLKPTRIGTIVPPDLNTGDPNFDHFNHDQKMIGYQLEHRINDTWTVRQKLRYGKLEVDYRALQAPTFAPLDPSNALNPINYRYLARGPFGSQESTSSVTMDNQVQAKLRSGDWQHTLLMGLDYQRTRIDQYTYSGGPGLPLLDIYAPVYGAPIDIPSPYVNGVSRLTQTGFYLQDQIKWGDRWSLTLGGRYDSARSSAYSRFDGTTQQISEHKFTKRAGLVYLMPNGIAPYLSYAESFAPTGTVDPTTRTPFKPESGRQYEAGVRYQPPGGKSLYSAAIFDLRRKNYITYDANFMPKQTGEISVRGLELEATTELMPRLNLTASYAYTPRAIVTASSRESEIGKQATAVPRNRLSVWADYRFSNGVKVGLGARFNGSTRGDGEVAAPAKLPAYTLIDAMIGYDIDRWTLALNLRNLTNKTYIANCAYAYCYYGTQRTAVATATYRW
ncbi:iron complex outermembrane receptor protein [Variovorax sp. TBS-050B]|uniref:TonB-dependent siderophore receptor n=1 Tax=Variovorax sp. TBS-050B TaxID=2940551 RepID=UPI0024735B64|nr:TonB-dependent siderophore receptor [Variovorax sp. TBS-050B]MDH6593500.1 iron complex outermembrane receptor protein [Variovorax sp. TBS-050B]